MRREMPKHKIKYEHDDSEDVRTQNGGDQTGLAKNQRDCNDGTSDIEYANCKPFLPSEAISCSVAAELFKCLKVDIQEEKIRKTIYPSSRHFDLEAHRRKWFGREFFGKDEMDEEKFFRLFLGKKKRRAAKDSG
ncbi:unnamed protein product [Dovyalis caffra]|uniref:Uncharacterized protein n=1 Tax=Dovyalis caffra TaxID=77055 RepID=A0AAV1R5N1_9ROSI|nr:unnamed protein product [Dovyalis caffra]